jgi:hypothetical protein
MQEGVGTTLVTRRLTVRLTLEFEGTSGTLMADGIATSACRMVPRYQRDVERYLTGHARNSAYAPGMASTGSRR